MPDYLTALICQYSGAVNSAQAESYARSFIDAWYFTLDKEGQNKLVKLLPEYLTPKKNIFGFKRQSEFKGNQSEILISRITVDLTRSGDDESRYIIEGLMKSLKIISSPEQKFAYSKLLDARLYKLYVGA